MHWIGIDMVHVPQFASQLADKASSFAQQTFTPREWRYAHQHLSNKPENHLSARFATKEAFIKAWSSSRWGKPPVLPNPDFRQLEVINDSYGRPKLLLHGELRDKVGPCKIQISISHDGDYAISTVFLFLNQDLPRV